MIKTCSALVAIALAHVVDAQNWVNNNSGVSAACTASTVFIPITQTVYSTMTVSPISAASQTDPGNLLPTTTVTATVPFTSTVTVLLSQADPGTLASSSRPYDYAATSGTISWLNGAPPTSGASLALGITSITVVPIPDSNTHAHITQTSTVTQFTTVTPPAYSSTTFSLLTADPTTTLTSTFYLTYSLSFAPSHSSFLGIGNGGWNDSTAAPRPMSAQTGSSSQSGTTTAWVQYSDIGNATTLTTIAQITATVEATVYTTETNPNSPSSGYGTATSSILSVGVASATETLMSTSQTSAIATSSGADTASEVPGTIVPNSNGSQGSAMTTTSNLNSPSLSSLLGSISSSTSAGLSITSLPTSYSMPLQNSSRLSAYSAIQPSSVCANSSLLPATVGASSVGALSTSSSPAADFTNTALSSILTTPALATYSDPGSLHNSSAANFTNNASSSTLTMPALPTYLGSGSLPISSAANFTNSAPLSTLTTPALPTYSDYGSLSVAASVSAAFMGSFGSLSSLMSVTLSSSQQTTFSTLPTSSLVTANNVPLPLPSSVGTATASSPTGYSYTGNSTLASSAASASTLSSLSSLSSSSAGTSVTTAATSSVGSSALVSSATSAPSKVLSVPTTLIGSSTMVSSVASIASTMLSVPTTSIASSTLVSSATSVTSTMSSVPTISIDSSASVSSATSALSTVLSVPTIPISSSTVVSSATSAPSTMLSVPSSPIVSSPSSIAAVVTTSPPVGTSTPSNPFPPTSATAVPTGGCGESGSFTLSFDDLPSFHPQNQTDITQQPPVFGPYHHLSFSTGYVYAPEPTEPFAPISSPNVAVFLATGAGLQVNGGIQPGEIGDGSRESQSAFWFDASSVYVGCDNAGPADCTMAFTGYTWSPQTNNEIASYRQNVTLPPCVGLTDCHLQQISLSASFRSLSGIQIQAYVGDEQRMFFMDDLSLTWSNSSCAAGLLRQSSR